MKSILAICFCFLPVLGQASEAFDRWKQAHAIVEQHKAEARYKRQVVQEREILRELKKQTKELKK